MNKYSILKQLFSLCKKCPFFRCKGFISEQISDISQDMPKTFLFSKGPNFVAIGTPEITYKNAVVKFTKVVDNNLRSTTFINMKESDW